MKCMLLSCKFRAWLSTEWKEKFTMRLFDRKRRSFNAAIGIMLLAVLLAACGTTTTTSTSTPSTSAPVNGKGRKKVGVLLPETATSERWDPNDLNYYVSFENTKVGALQGQYIADNYQSYVSANGTKNTVMINGAQTDNNALLFSKGAHSALDTLFNSGALKKVYEKFTPGWDNPTAQTEMQAALTANGNKVAIAYVANDGMANNVIAALKAVKLNGKVLVTGQDATAAGLQNILKGDQAMTVYKAITKEAMGTAQLVAALSNG